MPSVLYVLAAGDLITTVGSSAYMIVLLLIVANYSRNVFENGLVGDLSAIPELLLGVVVGLIVDRYSRRKLMLAANVTMAAISWIPALFLRHMAVGYYVLVLADLGVQIGNLVDLSSHNAYVKYLLPDADIRWGGGHTEHDDFGGIYRRACGGHHGAPPHSYLVVFNRQCHNVWPDGGDDLDSSDGPQAPIP